MKRLALIALVLPLACATVDVTCDRNGVDTIRGTLIGDASARCFQPQVASVPPIPAPGDQAPAPSTAPRGVTAEVKGGKLSSGGWFAVGILARGAACYISMGLLC